MGLYSAVFGYIYQTFITIMPDMPESVVVIWASDRKNLGSNPAWPWRASMRARKQASL